MTSTSRTATASSTSATRPPPPPRRAWRSAGCSPSAPPSASNSPRVRAQPGGGGPGAPPPDTPPGPPWLPVVPGGGDPKATKIGERMTRDLDTVGPRTDIAEAADHMARLKIRHLPVLEEGELVGVLSIRDLTNGAVHGLP